MYPFFVYLFQKSDNYIMENSKMVKFILDILNEGLSRDPAPSSVIDPLRESIDYLEKNPDQDIYSVEFNLISALNIMRRGFSVRYLDKLAYLEGLMGMHENGDNVEARIEGGVVGFTDKLGRNKLLFNEVCADSKQFIEYKTFKIAKSDFCP